MTTCFTFNVFAGSPEDTSTDCRTVCVWRETPEPTTKGLTEKLHWVETDLKDFLLIKNYEIFSV